MKRCSISLMPLILILLLCGSASATSFETRGSAVVNSMRARYYNSISYVVSHLWITNITGSDVTCRVSFYDHAGNDVTSYCKVLSGSESSADHVTISTGTGTFELPAGQSRFVSLGLSNTNRNIQGYAVIEWSSADSLVRKPLIAVGSCYTRSGDRAGYMTIPINGGQPF